MKFKIGERVRINTELYDEENFTYNNVILEEGTIVTVKGHDGTHYYVKGDSKNDAKVFFLDHDLQSVEDFSEESVNVPKKYNDNKPIMSLIRPEFQLALAQALTYGASKYEEKRGDVPNYLKGNGFNYTTIIDSLERHLNAFKAGINIDEESGLHHLSLAAANIMFLHTYEQCEKGVDDRVILKDIK
jgi:hypothetical protein